MLGSNAGGDQGARANGIGNPRGSRRQAYSVRHSGRARGGLRRVVPALLVFGVATASARAQWPQWGGPKRDFKSDATGLAKVWPPVGPEELWREQVGEGSAGVIVYNDVFTFIQYANDELRIMTNKMKDGMRDWSAATPASRPHWDQRTDLGVGPIASPVALNDWLIIIDFAGVIQGMNVRGKPSFRWSHELIYEFGGKVFEFGYTASPLAYQNSVIVAVGGERYGMMAFDPSDGSVVWTSEPLDVGYASPVLINVDGQDQVVVPCAAEVAGLDPNSGKLLWRHPHGDAARPAWFTPVWGDGNLLFVSSHDGSGSRVLHLSQKEGKTKVEERWHKTEVGFHRTNAIRLGDYIYGCAGTEEKSALVAVNVKTGDVAWREPGFPMANCVYVDGKLIVLDEKGTLSLVTVSPERLRVHSSTLLLEPPVRTAPIVVNNLLFTRSANACTVFDISQSANERPAER